MPLSATQQNSVDIVLSAAIEWDCLHAVPYFLEGEIHQLGNNEIDELVDLHLASGNPALYSSPRFDALRWGATGVSYPNEDLSLLEHVRFASHYLLPLAELMWGQVLHPEESVFFVEPELIQHWWTRLDALSMESETRRARLDVGWRTGSGDKGGRPSWKPFGGANSKDQGKSFEVVFDGEEMALPQVHAFLRLVIDTYLKGLEVPVTAIAIADIEADGPVLITFEPKPTGPSDLTLLKVCPSQKSK